MRIFFSRIIKVLAVERDGEPQIMNFAKVQRRGGGINREGAFVWINMVTAIKFDFVLVMGYHWRISQGLQFQSTIRRQSHQLFQKCHTCSLI